MSKIVRFVIQKIGIKFDAHKFKKFNDLGFIILEKILIRFPKLHHLYFDFYDEMTENEISLANISKDDTILHIGCGPIPATSILLAKKSGAQVITIDTNPRSVKQALYCLSEFKLSDKIQIRYSEVNHFPVGKFDLIIISQGIKSYNEVLEYIAQSMKRDARVIFRTSSSSSGELTQNDMFLKDIFTVSKMAPQKKNGLLISIMLFKK